MTRFAGTAALAIHGAVAVAAEPAASAPIYSCVDSSGRRLSSDRPIPECLSQDQRLLNRDGSVRGTAPAYISAEERARRDQVRRDAEQEKTARDEQLRRDRSLLSRYPVPAMHDAARLRALDPSTRQIAGSQLRLAELAGELQALLKQRAALGKQPVPPDLIERINNAEGATEAQTAILNLQQAERERIKQQFDVERARLDKLWAN